MTPWVIHCQQTCLTAGFFFNLYIVNPIPPFKTINQKLTHKKHQKYRPKKPKIKILIYQRSKRRIAQKSSQNFSNDYIPASHQNYNIISRFALETLINSGFSFCQILDILDTLKTRTTLRF